ncbi:uncharacterized protein [Choristoneura fumiferana]|uniref:uncharacterized protein n=1 Tax=Choristoneura fumiferana TaxID=7141 RepID=UPI003D158F1D
MQRPYNDRWERTRRHLLRNLFDYQGDLSPIVEEPESDSSDDRPYSPLPDLIVEREPNRHDHSEEYYEELAVRMRRYYQRLFIDGVSDCEATVDDLEEIPDFVINRSAASTFIIDTNNHIDEETHKLEADETREEFDTVVHEDKIAEVSQSIERESTYLSGDDKSDAKNISDDKEKRSEIQESSHNITTPSDAVTKDESEVKSTVNITRATQTPEKDASKSIETESDLVEACHRISSTVAEIHDELQQVRAPRVFEDGSPVLMPKAHELSRRVFGNMPLNVRNIMNSIHDDEEDPEKDAGETVERNGKDPQQVSHEIEDFNQSKSVGENSDLEIEWLIKSVDYVSNESQESVETCEEEEIFADVDRKQTPDTETLMKQKLDEFDDKNQKTVDDNNESLLRTSESDEIIQIQNEESIGPNEFNGIELSPKARHLEILDEEISEHAENSFEMALRKGLFETKNARKNLVPSSSEEFEDDSHENEDFEPVEVMRGTMQTRLTESLRRESTLSKDSPLVKTAIQATAEELEEDDFELEDCEVEAPDPVMTEAREEGEDRSLEIELTTSQDSYGTDANGTERADEFSSPDDLERVINASADKDDSSDNANTHTPSVTRIRSIADVCDDIWSVSPVNINFEDLPPKVDDLTPSCKTYSSQKKRASDTELNTPLKKKKKYNNIAVQTGTSKESTADGNDVKNNFVVGKPLVFRLCRCRDHVCL